jgi:ATP-dependent Clp protease ATP-binding subunit ClpC
MFERYTEKARRVVFFARYEASQFGSPYIESEHLLLGLLREDKGLTMRFFQSVESIGEIRRQIEGHTSIREKTSTSIDLPLSNECKRILAYAAEEAERLGHQHIGTEHLLLGTLREPESFAAEILKQYGLKLEEIRQALSGAPRAGMAGSVGGGGAAGVSSRARVVFVEGTQRIAFVPALGREMVPRIGDEVVLDSGTEGRRAYRVVNVKHVFEHYLADIPNAPYRTTGIVVTVERLPEESYPAGLDIAPSEPSE